ncbi:nucleotidyltransferase domain-containing protein [Paenibacillus luteus]|uniref:nucleotidyltransferase domain-containing protein n=1 Tax=Paenibacillus luteus TaxID=2545753 RepID=UPI001142ACFE|nr:nucleotidyltransferase domain-containing protein [Paenibacillus luteus]
MYQHHKQSLDKFVETLQSDPNLLAVITSGSIAKGTAKETSDIDVYLLVTDDDFEERKKMNKLSYTNHEVCNYEGGYIDGKIINRRFLELAAEKGSEPTRASFTGSQAVYSIVPNLNELINEIPIYPEQNRTQNIRDFQAQVMLYGYYFAGEAVKKNNPYLLSHAISNLVLFGSRIILAHNRILFPCHKSMMAEVEEAPEKPENFVRLAHKLLLNPNYEQCMELSQVILGFRNLELSFEQAVSLFVQNNEWNWIDQFPPLQDR